MKSTLLLSVVICTNILTGCVVAVPGSENDSYWSKSNTWQQYHENNRHKIAKFKLGDNYQQVLTDLGTPQFSEQIKKNDASYRVFFYATSSDGDMSKEACTPIVFKNDVIVGWGDAAYRAII